VATFSHIGTAQLQALRQLSEIFSETLPSTTTQHAPPMSQASSQLRSTVPPYHVPFLGPHIQSPPSSKTTSQSPRLARYPSQRVNPRQSPSPRVTPRVNLVHSASLRVNHTLPPRIIIPLNPHTAAANAPYVPQGMAGVNLFDTFEEEHMETPSLPRYNTRARARHRLPIRSIFLHHVFSAPLHS
jgi:hypothetical protein